jgi:ABC-type uncharacterized transport system auxiliary subunit
MYYKTKIFSLCVSVFFLVGGCVSFKQPRNRIQHYTLEYVSPEITDLKPLPVSLKVERFSVAPAYNTNRIIYRDGSFKRDEYFYHKWRANPADMVASFLSRDIRNSGLFKAVLPQETGFPLPYWRLMSRTSASGSSSRKPTRRRSRSQRKIPGVWPRP